MFKSIYRFKGHIYEVTGKCGNKYIGSTLNFKTRQYCHLSKGEISNSKLLEKPLTFKIIRTDSYKLLKTMNLVEQFYIDSTPNCINKKRSYVSEEKKKKLGRERSLRWYHANKDKPYVKMIRKARNDLYKDKDNGTYMAKAAKKWYNSRKNERVVCGCGSKVQRIKLGVHLRTKKHRVWEATEERRKNLNYRMITYDNPNEYLLEREEHHP